MNHSTYNDRFNLVTLEYKNIAHVADAASLIVIGSQLLICSLSRDRREMANDITKLHHRDGTYHTRTNRFAALINN